MVGVSGEEGKERDETRRECRFFQVVGTSTSTDLRSYPLAGTELVQLFLKMPSSPPRRTRFGSV